MIPGSQSDSRDVASPILVLGDSFAFGGGIDEDQTYPAIAEHLLSAALGDDAPWEVVNPGAGAWGPLNALADLESEGSAIGGSCLVYGFFPANELLAPLAGAPSQPPDAYGAMIERNDATLARLDALAKRRFEAFAIILLPILAQLTPEPASPLPVDLADLASLHVRQWAERHGVPVLDLHAQLPHDKASAEALYLQGDFHMSAAGHRRVGALLARNLPRLCAPRALSSD